MGHGSSDRRAPTRGTRAEREHNINEDSPRAGWHSCRECGKGWSPNLLSGGRRPRGWWRCPNGCNAPEEAS
jgi:hypothetical protein